jgi:hypothetical protein
LASVASFEPNGKKSKHAEIFHPSVDGDAEQ